jgi:ABC-2 type transport system ATP-binding protein
MGKAAMSAIRTDGLYKCYERRNWRGRVVESVEAVREISFEVQPGETAAFIGANGAGKSTTLRLLSGVLKPTRGQASVCGHRSGTPEAAMCFGFVSGNRSVLWSHMTVRQSLEIIGAIYGLRSAERQARIATLARELDLEAFLGRRGGTLSLGERMRCEMAAAVMHRPVVLLADEPTLGLDIPTRRALRELLRGWTSSSGTTLLLTSHDVGDIESLCERTLLIAKGRVVFDGPTATLESQESRIRSIRISLREPVEAPYIADSGLRLVSMTEDEIRYEFSLEELSVDRAIRALLDQLGHRIADLRVSSPSLEECLARYMGERP